MQIVYSLSVIVLLICFILLKKTDKKLDILSFIPISIILLFCYNTFTCYVLTFFTIKCSLLNLTLINLVFILIMLIPILWKKQIQSYKIKKTDLIYICIIAIIVIGIAIKNFKIPFNVNYETSDPSVHYLTAVMFAEQDSLLGANPDEVYGNLQARKTVSYVNCGLLMKIICPSLDAMDCYNVFACFGIFILFLTGWTFYSALMYFTKGKMMQLIAFVVTMVCIMGYPLNSFLFGFEYLSMGLLIICGILSMIPLFENDELKRGFNIIIFALFNFGLFSSYYMFVPFIYPALGLYFLIQNYSKNKKIITKEIIVFLIITLIIPFLLGYIYHIEPKIYRVIQNKTIVNSKNYSTYLVSDGIATDGYIYINLYSNMLLLLPLAIYLFIKHVKENKFTALAVGICIAFIELLLLGNAFGKVSIYYLSKNYFALWILLLYSNYKAMVKLNEKDKLVPIICTFGYVTIIIVYLIFSNTKMEERRFNKDENIFTVAEIFGANKTILTKNKERLNQNEIDIIMYARKNLDKTKKIEVVADNMEYYWAYVLLRYFNHEEFTYKYIGQMRLNAKVAMLDENVENVDYVIYFNKGKTFEMYKDKLFKNAEIIYENEAGGIVSRIR